MWLKSLVVVLLLTGGFWSTATLKKGTEKTCLSLKKDLQSRRSVLVSAAVQKRLRRVEKWKKKKDTQDRALQTLKKLEARARPSDLITIYKNLAYLYTEKENLPQAIEAYQQAMDLKKMSYREHLDVLYLQTRLYLLMEGRTLEAEQALEQWFCLTDQPPPQAYFLKALVHARKDNHSLALKWVMKAIQSSSSPQRAWLFMAAQLNMQKENYEQTIWALNQLIPLDPKKETYWKAFSQAYLRLKKENHSLAGWDLTRKMSFLKTQNDWIQVTNLFFSRGQPLQAARLLEQALKSGPVKKNEKHYKMLGNFWFKAQEKDKALKAYQRAATQARDGEIFLLIARHYMEDRKWDQAIQFFNKTLQKGKIKNLEKVYIQLGIALFRNGQPDQAIRSLEQILALEAESKWIKQAREWIDHISAQQQEAAAA